MAEGTLCGEGNRGESGHEGAGRYREGDRSIHVGDQNDHDREGNVRVDHHVVGRTDLACGAKDNGQNGPALGRGTADHP